MTTTHPATPSSRARARTIVALAALAGIGVSVFQLASVQLLSQTARGGPAQTLTPDDVTAIINAAASAISDTGMAVAVVDPAGTILGVYSRDAAAQGPDMAVSLARTTAYFSNDQAPLSSRTVRFISGIHFPPGIENTSNAALYGVENINRGCDLGLEGDAIFNDGIAIDRPRTIAGSSTVVGAASALPCRPDSTSGCSVGITT